MSVDEASDEEAFELLGKSLGAGGFATTHRARVLDPDLVNKYGTDIVALKIPLDNKKALILQDEIERNALLFQRLKEIQSRNLVQYLGFWPFRRQFVMVMEYVKDGSLRNRVGAVGRQNALPVKEAVEVSLGAARGLSVIHREHIFHRDIKPENILMDGGVAKISDLGISRLLDTFEMASTTSGTFYYMSPEILGEEGASFTSDIWSLGVTMYEMLSGRLPFGDRTTPIGKLADLIRRSQPVSICELRPEIPPTLAAIVERAMEKTPSRRFASADEMVAALESLQKNEDSELDQELGKIREALNNPELTGAMEHKLLELARKYPQNPNVYQQLGEFYNRCQRYLQGIAAFRQGLKYAPRNALLYWDLGLACQRIGNQKEAADALQKAIAFGLDVSYRRYAEILLKSLNGGSA
jgi:serine/threonine protein kinase